MFLKKKGVLLVLGQLIRIRTIFCQSFPVPFQRMTAFPKSGGTLWSFNNFASEQAYSDYMASPFQMFDANTKPGTLEKYDRNRQLEFRLENMPKILSAEHSLFLPFYDDGFAHLYRKSGDPDLFLQIYLRNGTAVNMPKMIPQRVDAFDAAVTSEEPVVIMVAVIRSLTYQNISDLTIYQFDGFGNEIASPAILASDILSNELSNRTFNYQPTVSTSVTADGSFMVSWVSTISTNINLIRTAYVNSGKPPAKAFIVANSQTSGLLMIIKCDALTAGDGHFCVYDEFTPTIAGADMMQRITYITQFSYSGSLYTLPSKLNEAPQNISVLQGQSIAYGLPYGGLVTITPDSNTSVRLYDRWWNLTPFASPDVMPTGVTVLPNNTILSLSAGGGSGPGDWTIQGFNVHSVDLPTFLNRSSYDDNPNIVSTEPALGSEIDLNREDFRIYFLDSNYTTGFGKIKIYSENLKYPRETITVQASLETLSSYNFTASKWAFNSPEGRYYITVEGGAFRSSIGEPLPGIGSNVWLLRTKSDSNRAEKDGVKMQIRLNTNNPGNEAKRIECSYLRSTESGEIYQVQLKKIGIGGKRTASNLANEFSLMIRNKDRSPLGYGNFTQLIDPAFGVIREESLFKDNWRSLVAIVVVLLAVIVGFAICHRKFPRSDNAIIFMLALSLADFVADFLFVAWNSFDIPRLAIPSILFLVLPFSFNLVASAYIIVSEVSNNPLFHEWFARNTLITSLVSILAATNPVLLNLLRARFLGFNSLSAPFSTKVTRMILLCTAIGVVIEDIPQLIIQIIYKTSNGYFKLFSFLSLVTSCMGILYSIRILARQSKQPRQLTETSTSQEFS
ncbi:hypothetical protein K493DRAFT_406955 [Basidiobolus meristosporus CBS 931.73]|uniref:Uncharacterized protein n=1 Tax=Basidiobolus meristosporus CBS 931.73 TaxID=1314790 RepID=A0A1Y1YHK4_9FUNG|nr:hypothetical protein K493DRAFT_406955 [Basidiobolus meristosporus CBS 931.73]|eukprot:ORX97363.1 hypothetical protein K493DRAFT_406955 [Basidiobolus meristosporus CBS 931.73]